jgi:transposase
VAIDEKSFRKRHDYVTLVVNLEGDRESATVEYVGDGRDEQSLEGFWQGLDEKRCAEIEAVAMDLWQAYQNSVRAHVPGAEEKIVPDRFHLMQHMVEAVAAALRVRRAAGADRQLGRPGQYGGGVFAGSQRTALLAALAVAARRDRRRHGLHRRGQQANDSRMLASGGGHAIEREHVVGAAV